MTPPSAMTRWLAIVTILGTGLVHFLDAQDAFGEATYKGLLFVGNGVAAMISSIGILRGQRMLGWNLGALVAGGSIVAYVASRTIGMPGLPAEPDAWFEPLGVVAMVCEIVFLVLFVVSRRGRSA